MLSGEVFISIRLLKLHEKRGNINGFERFKISFNDLFGGIRSDMCKYLYFFLNIVILI